tara:strand:+ start:28860 stop:29594 length:735 start_codon:yes stop_codon:yes gene_type:complete
MTKKATLYRMVTNQHICPFGIKSKYILTRQGYQVEDIHLTTSEEKDAFLKKHNIKTSPQTFIEGKRIGGYEELLAYFGQKTIKQEGKTYQPIIAIFITTFLMAVASTFAKTHVLSFIKIIEQFIAISMCFLGIMKLRDIFSFSNQFLSYDLLAQRYVPYAYIYPFIETIAGLLMIAGVLPWLSAPAALFIGSIGAISVFKAVYIEKREIKCACVGGDSSVPLGFVSMTENLMMVLMAFWIFIKL